MFFNNKTNPSSDQLLEHIQELKKEIRSLRKEQDKFRKDIHDFVKYLVKKQEHHGQQLSALLRSEYLDLADNLNSHRFKLYSQNEEDGMVLHLIKEAQLKQHTFVDIGCGMKGGNSGVLGHELGWRGLMIDAREPIIEKIRERYAHNPHVSAMATFVSPENINTLLASHNLVEPDFFSLDIDSYDYWVFEALECSPPIVVLEYNALFGKESITVPFGSLNENTPKGYHGASLKALTKLAEKKGYRLIGCDEQGINGFYLRNDILPNQYPSIDPDLAYRFKQDRYSYREKDEETTIDPTAFLEKIQAAKLDLISVE